MIGSNRVWDGRVEHNKLNVLIALYNNLFNKKASSNGFTGIVYKLIEEGANINIENYNGETALWHGKSDLVSQFPPQYLKILNSRM